jgi:hypothetical protein
MRYRLLLSLLFYCFSISASAQIFIKGKVLDRVSGAPVVNASVYLNNTSAGTVTGSNGEFVLNVKSVYTGELIISSVGYQPISYKIISATADKTFFTFKLEIKESMLTGIFIMNDAQRKEWLKIFKENFLGITEEADNCTIENTEAVYFAAGENKNSIYAYADTPLVIINKLLGYRISFDLMEFSYDKSKNSTYFLGYSRYEDLGDKKRWIKRRKQNYFGSTMHFYRSLTADQLNAQGFSIFSVKKQLANKDSLGHKHLQTDKEGSYFIVTPVKASDILITDSVQGKYYISSANQVMVKYNESPHSRFYLSNKVLVRGLDRFGFTAYITLQDDKVKVEVDRDGIIFSPLVVIYDGFWVYEKLGNQVPFNYVPE